MNYKIVIIIFILLIFSNIFFLVQALRYRNIVIERNYRFQTVKKIPKYKNTNYELKQLQNNRTSLQNATIFIGSSIIEQWDFQKHFPLQLFINRGVGEDNSSDILERFKEDVLNLKPKRVVVYLGTNDVKDNLALDQSGKNLERILKLSEENGVFPIFLLVLPVNYNINPTLHYTHQKEKIEALSNQLINTAKKHNAEFIDLYNKLGQREDLSQFYSKDGLHLNAKGYQFLSDIVLKAFDY